MRLALIAVLACAACLALAGPAAANTFNVTKTADTQDGACDADCSLREALHAADTNGQDDTISVPAGHYLLSMGGLTIDSNVTIAGANARTTVIDAASNSRVFEVQGGTVGMSHLTITGGSGTGGSGIDGEGGGIFNGGSLTLDSSTVDGNVAPNGGFFGGQGGGIFANDVVRVTNTTISGNQAKPGTGKDGQGGGVFDNENTTLTNVTIADNTGSGSQSDATGGVYINSGLTLVNTIIAGNTDNGTENDCVFDLGTVTDKGHNLEGGSSCHLTGTGDLQNANPLLGGLGNNGGETDTRALLAGSPAIDSGDATACPATDQRGVSRPQLSGCDIGAFELTPAPAPAPAPVPPPAADTTKPKIVVSGLHRACVVRKLKIRVTVTDASGVKRTRVTLNGKRLRLHGKTKFTITIDPRKLGRAKNVLRIVATDNAGNAVKRRVLRRCAKHRHAG